MQKILGLALFLFLIAAATDARADSIVNLKLENVGPGYYNPSLSNFYVYPYNFSVDQSSVFISLMCDDFNDDVTFGEQWSAHVYTIADIIAGKGQMNPVATNPATNGSLAVLNGQSTTQAYEEAAWLYQQLENDPTEDNAIDINHTVWALFATTSFYNDPVIQSWYNAAVAATSGLSDDEAENRFANVQFYTPIPGTQSSGGLPQEFIGIATPEPSTITLLLSGLIGVGLVARRGGRKASASLAKSVSSGA